MTNKEVILLLKEKIARSTKITFALSDIKTLLDKGHKENKEKVIHLIKEMEFHFFELIEKVLYIRQEEEEEEE